MINFLRSAFHRYSALVRPIFACPWLLILPLSVPALLPFWMEGLPRSFDGGLHLLRLANLHRSIADGYLFPRWSPDLILGFGYPLFNFYAPGSYYLAELLFLFLDSHYFAYIGVFFIAVWGAGFGMYFLARDILKAEGPLPPLLAALTYMFAPYFLTNIYIRGALAEATAQALLPWILWSGRAIFRHHPPRRFFLPFALCLGFLAITHNITLILFPPMLGLYLIFQWQQTQWDRHRLYLAVGAGSLAMGISAFFWLPVIAERQYLAQTAYEISQGVWLPASMWTWQNFIDLGWTFAHTFDRPIRLGLGQITLGAIGAVFLMRYRREWIYWTGVTIVCLAMMGRWALPIWQEVELLAIAQFAWRLLSIVSLPLALFAGAILLPFAQSRLRKAAFVLLAAFILFIQTPRLDWMDVFSAWSADLSQAVFAQVELEKGVIAGGEGNSSIQEFRPRWAARSLILEPPAAVAPASVELHSAEPYAIDLTVTAQAPTVLRFATFFYPGWEILRDGATDTSAGPSTNLGLIGLETPAGESHIVIKWRGTSVQHVAAAVSLLSLAALALIAWKFAPPAVALGLTVGLLAVMSWSNLARKPNSVEFQPTTAHFDGFDLLGYRWEQSHSNYLYVYPYWLVSATPSPDIRLQWSVVDSQGATVSTLTSRPQYNTLPTEIWPPNTVVDDAYRIALPESLPAGTYSLELVALSITSERDAVMDKPRHEQVLPTTVGTVNLKSTGPDKDGSMTPISYRFGDSVALRGFSILANDKPAEITPTGLTTVRPGDYLEYRLRWQATDPIDENYHAFVHLVDNFGAPLVQEDHLPGPFFRPPLLWDELRLQPDSYLLRLPREAKPGLYWPNVGMYDFATLDRLPVFATSEDDPTDHASLPPIKIRSDRKPLPAQEATVRIGSFAELLGFDGIGSEAQLYPGEELTVTLYYSIAREVPEDYRRFLQLYSHSSGLAAQQDGIPQQGANPTWSWSQGEYVSDPVDIRIDPNALSGRYTLYMGFYDPDSSQRVPLYDSDGNMLADSWVPLSTVEILPARP